MMTVNGLPISERAPAQMKLPTNRVEVNQKPGFLDAAGSALLHSLQSSGIAGVTDVRTGQIYEITGRYAPAQLQTMAKELLSDPITQDFAVYGERPPHFPIGSHWRIEVWLKPSVSDPVGDSVAKAIADLGLNRPEKVRCGSVHKIQGRISQQQAERIAVKLLANPVIHKYTILPC